MPTELKDHILPPERFQDEHRTVWDRLAGRDTQNMQMLRDAFPFADWKQIHRAHYRGYLGSWGGYIEAAICADSTWWLGLFKEDPSLEYAGGFTCLLARQGELRRSIRSLCKQYQAVAELTGDFFGPERLQMPEEDKP
jgi:hypothetical protein